MREEGQGFVVRHSKKRWTRGIISNFGPEWGTAKVDRMNGLEWRVFVWVNVNHCHNDRIKWYHSIVRRSIRQRIYDILLWRSVPVKVRIQSTNSQLDVSNWRKHQPRIEFKRWLHWVLCQLMADNDVELQMNTPIFRIFIIIIIIKYAISTWKHLTNLLQITPFHVLSALKLENNHSIRSNRIDEHKQLILNRK